MEVINKNELKFVKAFSNEVDDKFQNDFIYVIKGVFGEKSSMNKESFKRQFIENIYGNSVLVIVYSDDSPVAARALWRNDIDGKVAYQPCSTAVLKEYQGKGIFKIMTNFAIESVEKDAVIYNFPNKNSYPQYLKIGWRKHKTYKTTILTSFKNLKNEHPQIIDNEYLNWWILPKKEEFLAYKKGQDIYLVKKRKWNIYFIKGRIHPDYSNKFSQLRIIFPFFLYYGSGFKFYNKNKTSLNVIINCSENIIDLDIPTYKHDVI